MGSDEKEGNDGENLTRSGVVYIELYEERERTLLVHLRVRNFRGKRQAQFSENEKT